MSKKICKYSIITVISALFLICVLIFITIYLNSEILKVTLYSENGIGQRTFSVIKINGNGKLTVAQYAPDNEINMKRRNELIDLVSKENKESPNSFNAYSTFIEGDVYGRNIVNYATKVLSLKEICILMPKLIDLYFNEYYDDIMVMTMADVPRAVVSFGNRMCICIDHSKGIDELWKENQILIDVVCTCVDFSPIDVRERSIDWKTED